MHSIVIVTIVFSLAHASIDIGNVNDIKQQLPSELSNTNLTLDDAKVLLKNKCIKVAGDVEGERAFFNIEEGTMNFTDCITSLVNFTEVQSEIEELKPQGDLDLVFNKYCRKRPEALKCVKNFNEKLVPCLDRDEQEANIVFMRIISSLLNFICHKDGDRIALFIAEKGPECLESKKDQITHCLNTTFSSYIPKENSSENLTKYIPKLTIGEKQCDDMEELEDCIVNTLESCSEITPANIVESMFRFIRNETICRPTVSAVSSSSLNSRPFSILLLSVDMCLIFLLLLHKVFS